MSEQSRRVNVQWTFKRVNREADGMATEFFEIPNMVNQADGMAKHKIIKNAYQKV